MVLCLFLCGHIVRFLSVEFWLGLSVWSLDARLHVLWHAHGAKWWWTQAVDSLQDRAAHTWCWGQWAKPLCLPVSLCTTTQSLLQQLLHPVMRPPVSTAPATVIGMNMTVSSEIYYSVRPPPQTWYKSNRIKIYLLPLRHLPKNNLLYCVTDTANPLLFTWHAQLYLSLYSLTQPSTTAWLTTCDREALDFRSVWVCERIGFPTGIYFGCCGYWNSWGEPFSFLFFLTPSKVTLIVDATLKFI